MTKPDFEKVYANAIAAAKEIHKQETARGAPAPKTWAKAYLEDRMSRRLPDGRQDISSPMSGLALILNLAQEADMRNLGNISDECAQKISEIAQNDFDTQTLARILISRSTRSTIPLPAALQKMAAQFIEFPTAQKSTKGDRGWKTARRDEYYLEILMVLYYGFKLTATKSPASNHFNTACDLLVEITLGLGWLNITYNGAEKLWKGRKKSLYRKGLVNLANLVKTQHPQAASTPYLEICDRLLVSV